MRSQPHGALAALQGHISHAGAGGGGAMQCGRVHAAGHSVPMRSATREQLDKCVRHAHTGVPDQPVPGNRDGVRGRRRHV